MTSEGREGERAALRCSSCEVEYDDYPIRKSEDCPECGGLVVPVSPSPEADGGDGRADERAVPRVPDPSEDTGTCGHAAEGAEAGHRPLKHLIADVMRVTSDPRILTPLFEIAQRANPSSPEPSSEGERWRIYVCDRCDALSETPLDGYACPGWEGTGREDHIGRQVEVARASEATTLRKRAGEAQLKSRELRRAEQIQMDRAEAAEKRAEEAEERLDIERVAAQVYSDAVARASSAEADLAQLRERVEGLERALEGLERALEGLLFMTINGVLCQEEDACSHCKPLWKRARTALEPPPPDTQEVGDGE